jgi:flavodoxin
MKTLIVYYSRDGATRKVADELKEQLSADIEEITEPKGRGGPLGWIRSGKEGSDGSIVPINPPKADPSIYDVIIIGTPTWARNVSSPVRSYLATMEGKLPRVAFFCTMSSKAGETFKVMEGLAGKSPIATTEIMTGDAKSGAFNETMKKFVDKIKTTS